MYICVYISLSIYIYIYMHSRTSFSLGCALVSRETARRSLGQLRLERDGWIRCFRNRLDRYWDQRAPSLSLVGNAGQLV